MFFVINQVRSYAARAIGTMASGIEEDGLKDLLSWLLTTLKSNSGSVDRAGAAQGKLALIGTKEICILTFK